MHGGTQSADFVQRMKPIDSICSLLILCQDTYGQWWDAKLWCYWFTNHLGLLAAVEIADPFVLCSYYYHAAGSSFRSTRNSDPSLDQSLVCWSAGGIATSGKLLLPIHVDVLDIIFKSCHTNLATKRPRPSDRPCGRPRSCEPRSFLKKTLNFSRINP